MLAWPALPVIWPLLTKPVGVSGLFTMVGARQSVCLLKLCTLAADADSGGSLG